MPERRFLALNKYTRWPEGYHGSHSNARLTAIRRDIMKGFQKVGAYAALLQGVAFII